LRVQQSDQTTRCGDPIVGQSAIVDRDASSRLWTDVVIVSLPRSRRPTLSATNLVHRCTPHESGAIVKVLAQDTGRLAERAPDDDGVADAHAEMPCERTPQIGTQRRQARRYAYQRTITSGAAITMRYWRLVKK
jgi:hypothetical protein